MLWQCGQQLTALLNRLPRAWPGLAMGVPLETVLDPDPFWWISGSFLEAEELRHYG